MMNMDEYNRLLSILNKYGSQIKSQYKVLFVIPVISIEANLVTSITFKLLNNQQLKFKGHHMVYRINEFIGSMGYPRI